MRLKPGMSKKTLEAVAAFHDYACGCTGSTGRLVRRFRRERPVEARVLAELCDASRAGLNHAPARLFMTTANKVRFALEDAHETDGVWRGWGRWMRRYRLLPTVVALVLALPLILAPTHPLAVYGYLVDSYGPSLTPKAFAFSGTDLPSFLTSPAQVRRYKADLCEDMLDTRSGKLFAIVRCPDGRLRQEAIRTWNGFLPAGLPASIGNWSDRKELPFLGDEVDTWLRGNKIIAMGHYHAFGGPPSAGDTTAQYFSDLPEIVVVNGLVPMVHLDGKVLPYGGDVSISEDVFRSLRSLEPSLIMDGTRYFSFRGEHPSQALESFLAFLRDYRNADLNRTDSVMRGIQRLSVEFKDDYQPVFTKGFFPSAYGADLDRSNLLENLHTVDSWVGIIPGTP